MYGKDQKAAIKEESEKSKKGLGNCLSGQYWIVKQEKKERRKISTRRLSQGAITGNNEENAMKFAERILTLSLVGQENELVLENCSGNKEAGETN